MSLIVTCPVDSVERATTFYAALGFTLNAEVSDHAVSCFAIATEQYIMLGSREIYASVGVTGALRASVLPSGGGAPTRPIGTAATLRGWAAVRASSRAQRVGTGALGTPS